MVIVRGEVVLSRFPSTLAYALLYIDWHKHSFRRLSVNELLTLKDGSKIDQSERKYFVVPYRMTLSAVHYSYRDFDVHCGKDDSIFE